MFKIIAWLARFLWALFKTWFKKALKSKILKLVKKLLRRLFG